MAEAVYPGAVWRPGVQAGYANGHTSMRAVVCHYTVGRDSRPVGDRGYFHFLVSRDGTVTQFCEAGAVAWHAGTPWNQMGPGIEVEYLDEDTIFTDPQRDACGKLVRWLHDQYGIPLNFYDGDRVSDWNGFITHRSLIQTGDWHSDYWPREDWDRMAQEEDEVATLYIKKQNPPDEGVWVTDGIVKRWVTPEEWAFATTFGKQKEPLAIGDQWWNSMPVAK